MKLQFWSSESLSIFWCIFYFFKHFPGGTLAKIHPALTLSSELLKRQHRLCNSHFHVISVSRCVVLLRINEMVWPSRLGCCREQGQPLQCIFVGMLLPHIYSSRFQNSIKNHGVYFIFFFSQKGQELLLDLKCRARSPDTLNWTWITLFQSNRGASQGPEKTQ